MIGAFIEILGIKSVHSWSDQIFGLQQNQIINLRERRCLHSALHRAYIETFSETAFWDYKVVFILTQVNLQKLNQQKKRPFCLENKSKTFLLLKNTNHSRNCVQQREKWNLLINDFPLLQLDELVFWCSFFGSRWIHPPVTF